MPPPQKSRSVLDGKMVFVVELMRSYWFFFFFMMVGEALPYTPLASTQHQVPLLLNYYIREWNFHKPLDKK